MPRTRGADDVPLRVARALVVAAGITPVVVLAHLATLGDRPGLPGLAAVVGLVALVTYAAPPTGTVRLATVVALAQVAGHGALAALAHGGTQGGCLPAVGRGAEAGLRLALLRADAACVAGTVAAGPTLTALLGAVVTAVALVVGHVLVAAVAARLVTVAESGAAAGRRLLGAVLPALPRSTVAPPIGARRLTAGRWVPVPLTTQTAAGPLTRRGPPGPRPA